MLEWRIGKEWKLCINCYGGWWFPVYGQYWRQSCFVEYSEWN